MSRKYAGDRFVLALVVFAISVGGIAKAQVKDLEARSLEVDLISEAEDVAALDAIIPQEDWLVKSRRPIQQLTKQQVEQFMRTIPNTTFQAACAYRMVDATKDFRYELIVVHDVNGRHFCNAVSIVRRDLAGYGWQVIKAANVEDLTTALKDLDGDGIPELVVPFWYEGRPHPASWTAIYRWDGSHYSTADASFPEVYRKRLEELNVTIQRGETTSQVHSQIVREDASSSYMERDRILRFLHLDPRAGLERAGQWAKDASPLLRERAAAVLSETDDPQAVRHLQELTPDRNRSVSERALTALTSRESAK
jgi:hypothetical protein